ncbi:INO80 complex subunit E isoform X3 [Lemur catta]|uniref:INO80 complex subunit E isoform X3 n=1 Tax=Lemur catta TaxID=9447 RepID=UPI001E26855C|nr:INO80 complex subunit E isoform X3 [Lemur catta]
MNGPADGEVDYKKKYRNLKRKLKFLIYEHECFQEELRKAQRKLLKVSRDKSFLLDRLLQYENVDEDSSDSDATASSDNSETEGTPKLSDTPAPKRKRSPPLGGAPSPSSLSLPPSAGFPLQASGAPSPYLSSLPEPSPLRPKREKRPRLPRKLKELPERGLKSGQGPWTQPKCPNPPSSPADEYKSSLSPDSSVTHWGSCPLLRMSLFPPPVPTSSLPDPKEPGEEGLGGVDTDRLY